MQNLSIESVFREVDARVTQAERSVTGSGSIAEVHVEGLAQKISAVLGQKCPGMMRERRQLIDGWHRHMKRQMRASPRGARRALRAVAGDAQALPLARARAYW